MSGTIWAQYGEALVLEIYAAKASDGQIAASGDWTIASGDFKVSKDEAAEANPTTLPAFVASSDKIKVSLSAAEMTGKEILLKMKDDATVLGDYWRIKTFGHQSAADPRGVLRRGTLQAALIATVTLDAGASAVDDFYNGDFLRIVSGTGAGQERQILDYSGVDKIATVYISGPPVQGSQWATALDNTSVFEIYHNAIIPAAITIGVGGIAEVNVTKIAGQTANAAAAVTFPATLASTTNITAGVITTVTNLTNLPTMPTDWITSAGLSAGAVTEMQSGLATAAALTTVDDFLDTEIAAIKAKTDSLTFTVAGQVDATLPATQLAAVADKILGRNIAGGSDGGRTVTSALRRVRNRRRINGGNLETYREDDTTLDHSDAITTGVRNPITESDPS